MIERMRESGPKPRGDECQSRKCGGQSRGQDGDSHKHRPGEDGDHEADQGQIRAQMNPRFTPFGPN